MTETSLGILVRPAKLADVNDILIADQTPVHHRGLKGPGWLRWLTFYWLLTGVVCMVLMMTGLWRLPQAGAVAPPLLLGPLGVPIGLGMFLGRRWAQQLMIMLLAVMMVAGGACVLIMALNVGAMRSELAAAAGLDPAMLTALMLIYLGVVVLLLRSLGGDEVETWLERCETSKPAHREGLWIKGAWGLVLVVVLWKLAGWWPDAG